MLIWSIGEILWDLFPDAERFGGAPLNIAANLQRLGHTALLLSGVGEDKRGAEALRRMRHLGLSIDGVVQVKDVPTGTAKVSFAPDGEPGFHIPRPAAFDFLSVDHIAHLPRGPVDWLYFGTLGQTQERIELLTKRLAEELSPVGRFYDMNLRAGHWTLPLVQRLSHLATMMKLNEDEAKTLFALVAPKETFSLDAFSQLWSSVYEVPRLCITLGARGCYIYDRGETLTVPGFKVEVVDTVGSGDAFSAAFLHGQSQDWSLQETARFANALGALVASRPGAVPPWNVSEAEEILSS